MVGISDSSSLADANRLIGSASKTLQDAEEKITIDIGNGGRSLPGNKSELNSDHTHFIVVDDTTPDNSGKFSFMNWYIRVSARG